MKLAEFTGDWVHPASTTAEERKTLVSKYKNFKAAHVFVQAVSSHSGGADIPAAMKKELCEMSDIPERLVHMTEFRHMAYSLLEEIAQEHRHVNHFLPIDSLLLKHEHIRPTANVALVLSKTTLEANRSIRFSLSKNGYYLTREAAPARLFSCAWNLEHSQWQLRFL